jgi:hypothetical protein
MTNVDIIQIGQPLAPFVVCGFFTETYRPLAEQLSRDLGDINPHHLFFRAKGECTWRDVVQMKPDIILEAMRLYPQTPIIFLDVDSRVRGSVASMIDFHGDVSARAKLRLTGLPGFRKKTVLHITTRSMVVKPNERTTCFLEDWKTEMRQALYHQGGCEMAMRIVLMRSIGLAYCPMDPRFAGIEVGEAPPDAVVVHDSASRVQGRS